MKIKPEILGILSGCVMEGPNLRLPEKLDRKVYQEVAKIIDAAIAFRWFVDDRRGTINPLPEGSFKSSGTDVNTALVQFRG